MFRQCLEIRNVFLLDMKQERKASQRDAFLPVSNLACANKCYFCRQCTYIVYVIYYNGWKQTPEADV
jgi:hypothetical protein